MRFQHPSHNQALEYFAEKDEGKIYLAELLLKLKGKGDEAEAKDLLEKVAESDDRYFRNGPLGFWQRSSNRNQTI